ncbi:MAG: enoyl-CoA hydratase/isomerase family protein, partial [Alphaproteobacteria bacterium]|nr:enoyl-CoA hydratase/isomerase family protein [Alphaproteobacteria bacterium]MBU1755446.1 enoyl-CoA hydratase/isomerase family protein [Alphaproteobacteria bacterium]
MQPSDRLSFELADNGVAHVRLTRGDKMNALDPAMFDAIIAAGEHVRTLSGLRAVVLSGEGRAFCTGLDMASFTAAPSGEA